MGIVEIRLEALRLAVELAKTTGINAIEANARWMANFVCGVEDQAKEAAS